MVVRWDFYTLDVDGINTDYYSKINDQLMYLQEELNCKILNVQVDIPKRMFYITFDDGVKV